MTAIYAALLLAGQQSQGMSGAEVLSKVLAKYADAKSATGEFTMSQSAGSKKIAIQTEFQMERPSKLFIHQTSSNVAPNDWLVVSDGVNFGYDAPNATQRRRLFEPVSGTDPVNGKSRSLRNQGIFMAAKRSLGDPTNPFLEFLTQSGGDQTSVQGFLTRLFKIGSASEKEVGGAQVYSISGLMGFGAPAIGPDGKQLYDNTSNHYPIFESAGRFELQVTKDFDLVGMKTTENITATDAATNTPTQIVVITTWTGKVKLNELSNPSLFTVK